VGACEEPRCEAAAWVEALPGGADADPLRDPAVVRALASEHFLFDAFVCGEPRLAADPLVLPEALHRDAVRAAEEAVHAIDAVAALAHGDARAARDERRRYEVSPAVERLVSASHDAGDRGALVRVDLLLQDDGRFVACEINADCPGGHNETLALPTLARRAGFHGGYAPPCAAELLADRLAELAREADGDGATVGCVYATAYAEDLQICVMMRRLLEARGVRAILAPPTMVRFDRGRLRVGDVPLGAVYRYFPAEYMEGQKNLDDWEVAIRSGAVRTLSSFAHLYAQSKLAFARAWAHVDAGGALGRRERAAIAARIPRTVDLTEIDDETLHADRAGWVVKRAFGRVGDEVFVGGLLDDDEFRAVIAEARARISAGSSGAGGETWIAQRFVRQRALTTPWGPRLVTLGAYVLDGRFAGYFARLTPDSHVSHDARCVPVFVRPSDDAAHARCARELGDATRARPVKPTTRTTQIAQATPSRGLHLEAAR
jgi:hypothetical protein